jgi:single-strand DNA-binding protein
MNRVTLIGRCGKNPEVRSTQTGDCVINVSLATSEKWKGNDGQMHEKTEWHNLVAFGRTAEVFRDYVCKGKQIAIEGKIQYEEYEKDGIKRYATKIKVDRLELLGSKNDNAGSSDSERPVSDAAPPGAVGDDEIPF